jgi:hypothetical protein
MIELRLPPAIGAVSNGGWQLVFWIGEAFDHAMPCEPRLTRSPWLWGAKHAPLSSCPGHEEFEDFIEGTLHVGNEVLHIYFEHARGYLSPSGKDQATLRRT